MPIRDYFAVLRRRWWLFILLAALAAATAYGISKAQQPIYRSTAKLYLMPSRLDLGLTITGQNLVRQYSQLLTSDRFLQKVNEDLRLDLPLPVLRERLHASGTSDNLAIQLEADHPDPAKARQLAAALAREFIRDQERRMASVELRDRIEVTMYDEPTPSILYRPQTRLNVIAAVVLGLVVAALAAFAWEYLDDTVKSAEDVERYVALPVLGSVPTLPANPSEAWPSGRRRWLAFWGGRSAAAQGLPAGADGRGSLPQGTSEPASVGADREAVR